MSDNLALTQLVQSQANKEVTINDQASELDAALTDLVTIDLTGTTSPLVLADGQALRAMVLKLIGTHPGGAFTVELPANRKLYVVWNTTGERVTVAPSSGSGVDVEDTLALVYCDGTDVLAVASGGAGGNSLSALQAVRVATTAAGVLADDQRRFGRTSASSARWFRTWRSSTVCSWCCSSPSSAAIIAVTRAGQLTQASRSSRASRNTWAVAFARSINSPFIRCRRTRRSCALSTSLAVRACMKVIAPATTGSPCSRSVSRTAPTAASGTGLTARCCRRCWARSVLPDHAAWTLPRSQEPSASRRIRPLFSARRTAVSLTPICRASSRLLVVRIHQTAARSELSSFRVRPTATIGDAPGATALNRSFTHRTNRSSKATLTRTNLPGGISMDLHQSIRDANDRGNNAFNGGDAAAVAGLYTADATVLPHTHDVVRGAESIRSFWQSVLDAGFRNHAIELIDVHADGDLVVETAKWRAEGPGDGSAPQSFGGSLVNVFERQSNGDWKCRLHIWN